MIKPDGTGLREVTHLPGSAEQPAWSPDGSRFAFEWNTGAGDDLYLITADGTGLRRLTSHPGRALSPAWSPDGSRIAFAYAETAFQGGIYTIAADGRDWRSWSEATARTSIHRGSLRDERGYTGCRAPVAQPG